MNELQASLKIALANTFIMYFKAHTYHWNVEGIMFPQFHNFFGDLYEETYGAVDPLAEHIRILGAYAPVSIMDLVTAGTVSEDVEKPASTGDMVNNLIAANDETLRVLNKAFLLAAGDNGLQDFLAGRIDAHAKHSWMLKSILK